MALSTISTSYVGSKIGAQTPDSVQQFNLGHRADGDAGGLFLYGKAGAALAAGDFVVFDKDYTATLLTTANSPRGAKVAVNRVALAANQFGWFQVEGGVPARTAAAIAAAAQINTTATGGAVDDDAAVGSKRIEAIFIPVAAAGATTNTEFHLHQPYVGVTL